MQTLIDKETGRIRQGTGVIVLDWYQRGVWLSRRFGGSFDRYWQCPGGKLELNETPAEGASRELTEETGLIRSLLEGDFLLTTVAKNARGAYLFHWFWTIKQSGEVLRRTEPDQAGDWVYFPFKELSFLNMTPNCRELIKLVEALHCHE